MGTFDAIIVGGGPAGCATALAFVRSAPQASFLLVDNWDPTQFKVGESLPPDSKQTLHRLSPSLVEGLLQDTAQGRHSRCAGNASVWQSPDLQETYAIMNPYGAGWHLDRSAFDETLREQVRSVCAEREAKDCAIIKGTFKSVQKDEHRTWAVVVASDAGDEQSYSSKWLIDASGRQASVARKLGAKTTKLDGLLAFYMVFASTEVDRDTRTLIEASDNGWWYSSQLPDQRRIVVFHTDDCDSTAKLARNKDTFLDMLHNDTTHVSHAVLDNDYRPMSGPKANYPRCTAAASSFLSPFGSQEDRWCAVGDAAMAFDPLSSQGMLTALRSGLSVGAMLANQTLPDAVQNTPEDVEAVTKVFEAIREDYEKKKRYYYAQSIFRGPFWQRRLE
ncbi:unnamed protein product [Rhizoctonia solani]|uniref:FAD-binding domain-containing protein n=1 Tax=Rhizoctonia solani TaxID=456999 RepID=A0A8H3HTK8_9AGAM|nr:unnamed protein product [Rhizoctonia solani]